MLTSIENDDAAKSAVLISGNDPGKLQVGNFITGADIKQLKCKGRSTSEELQAPTVTVTAYSMGRA